MRRTLLVLALMGSFAVPVFATAQSYPGTACPQIARTLSIGSRGSDVLALQVYLASQGLLSSSSQTGYFGVLTQRAVQTWQMQSGIVSSGTPSSTGFGIVGPKTRVALLACQPSTIASPSSPTTSTPTPAAFNASCVWNGAILPSGSTLVAYQAPKVSSGSQCISEIRHCVNSSLSGSYLYGGCEVDSGGTGTSCTWNNQSIQSGQSTTAYQSATVPSGSTCVAQTRTCNNGVLNGSFAYAQCSVQPLAGRTPSGWDYDLTKECAMTTGNPGDPNYYADTKQCTNAKHWALVVESENAPGASCPGPGNRSFPINDVNSPISLQWLPHTSELGSNWTVNLKVDQNTKPNPCGDSYFTYFGMMDHVDLQGGPLPDMTHLVSSHTVAYGEYTPNATDSARLLVGAQVFWDGKAHILEVDLARSQWENPAAHPAGTIYVNKDFGGSEYVVLDAAYWNIAVADDSQAHTVTVPWNTLFAKAIASGWFTAPTGPNATQAVYIGTEVKGRAVGNLYQTNFRVSSVQ